MREFFFRMLDNAPSLSAMGLRSGSVYQANTIDTSPAERPFLSLSWGGRLRAGGVPASFPIHPRVLTVWVYDEPGDYRRIDRMIVDIRHLIIGTVAQEVGDGLYVSEVRWTGDSQDLYDDVYKAILRTTSYEVISNAG